MLILSVVPLITAVLVMLLPNIQANRPVMTTPAIGAVTAKG